MVNPDGISSTVQNAFTVTEGAGNWLTSGAYWGQANFIAQHPVDPQVLYVGAQWVGIFQLRDWLLQIQPHFNQTFNCNLNQDAIYL